MNSGLRIKKFMADRMPGCDRAGYLVSKSLETKLRLAEKVSMRIHLCTCSVCRNYEKQLHDLQHLVTTYREFCMRRENPRHLDAAARARLVKLVDHELTGKP